MALHQAVPFEAGDELGDAGLADLLGAGQVAQA
ncbi:hypothetical protein SMD44_08525 [Streptomyces alboflavus]|uniref:Uncharacterized protein n=1 Tax=Streptomyces alboflavus TaxID=67267 RepID=A0A1Z1WRH3_9ACTN|nr:hypothetical protein SMD44_08525 [Streptomyces alboflavus]